MDEKFEEGTTVRLKSGGPRMTIINYPYSIASYGKPYEDPNQAECEWFDSENKLQKAVFKLSVLDIVENLQ